MYLLDLKSGAGLPDARDFVRLGCFGNGAIDAFCDPGGDIHRIVDLAAIALIVEKSGGAVRDIHDRPFTFDPDLLKFLQSQKRAAYSPSNGNEDPQLHELALGMQGKVLAHILHPKVMQRLVDSAQYGNTYMPHEVLDDLYNGIFVQKENPSTFKMNLQSKYVDGLIDALSDKEYDEISKSAIYSSLIEIEKFSKRPYGDDSYKNHLKFINWKVNKALDS